MKLYIPLIFSQLIVSVISAFLMSQMSFAGKLGISFLYKEYSILKDPVKTGLAIFGMQLLILLILALFRQFTSTKVTNLFAFLFFVAAILGILYSYHDFTENFSHRILKQNFHFGVYLVWIGIILTCLFFWMNPKKKLK